MICMIISAPLETKIVAVSCLLCWLNVEGEKCRLMVESMRTHKMMKKVEKVFKRDNNKREPQAIYVDGFVIKDCL